MRWTTSFPRYERCTRFLQGLEGDSGCGGRRFVGLGTDRTDRAEVVQLGLDDRVDLLGQVGLAGLRSPGQDVFDGLGAPHDDVTGGMRRRAVAGESLALDELELELQDPAHVVRGER